MFELMQMTMVLFNESWLNYNLTDNRYNAFIDPLVGTPPAYHWQMHFLNCILFCVWQTYLLKMFMHVHYRILIWSIFLLCIFSEVQCYHVKLQVTKAQAQKILSGCFNTPLFPCVLCRIRQSQYKGMVYFSHPDDTLLSHHCLDIFSLNTTNVTFVCSQNSVSILFLRILVLILA